MKRRFRLVYGEHSGAKEPREQHGFGLDFMLGVAFVRLEMDVGTGKIALQYYDPKERRKLDAAWRVRRMKDKKFKIVLAGLGVALGEFMFWEESASDMFHALKRRMGTMLGE